MASESHSPENSKKRRIMIITGDESIIHQIQNGNHAALIKSYVLDPTDPTKANELTYSPVRRISFVLFLILENRSQTQTEVPTTPPKKTKAGSLTCVVCSATALGYNFDAITCESCKAFFRRNALKDSVKALVSSCWFSNESFLQSTFQCRRHNDCDITVETRRRCSACRLAKCLQNGMKRERLLTVERDSFFAEIV